MDPVNQKIQSIGAVLLASGNAKRMGENKLMLPLGNPPKPCVRWVAEALVNSGAGQIIVVYQEDHIKEALRDLDLIFIRNEKSHEGKSAAVKLGAAFPWKEGIQGIAFTTGDQPLLRGLDYRKIFESYLESGANMAVPVVDGVYYNPRVFSIAWQQTLMNLKGDSGGKALMTHPAAIIKEVPFEDPKIFMDMDTPEDYKTLCGLINTLESWRDGD